MRLWIQNGWVIDPASGINSTADIVIEDGKIIDIKYPGKEPDGEVFDARGLIVAPGLVDMHCHLREPGQTHKEDIASGTKSAAKGGFTSIACMPNTTPPLDTPELIAQVRNAPASVHVHPFGTITRGMKGAEMSDLAALKEAGAVGVSDDGLPVVSAKMMHDTLLEAKKHGLTVTSHCEEPTMKHGVIHDGVAAKRLGVQGISPAAEECMVAREIVLATVTDSPVHIAHISTRGSVNLIRDAKARGVKVTAETCPHYFSLTDEVCMSRNSNTKMNPPLRTPDDVAAIIEGLKDGTIDAIATDHAPHHADEKGKGFSAAPNGIIGFETALAVAITYLVKPGHLSMIEMLRKFTQNPGEILGIPAGRMVENAPADFVLFDPHEAWEVKADEIVSKSKNTPYLGYRLYGKVRYTFVDGKIVE